MNFKELIKSFLCKGFKIGYSSGKSFDPTYQERTDPIKDMIKADKKRRKKNGINK